MWNMSRDVILLQSLLFKETIMFKILEQQINIEQDTDMVVVVIVIHANF